jgi:hypothetical protein
MTMGPESRVSQESSSVAHLHILRCAVLDEEFAHTSPAQAGACFLGLFSVVIEEAIGSGAGRKRRLRC